MLATEFGFYPVRYDTKLPAFEISTLDDFDEQVNLVKEDPSVKGDWIYAPPQEQMSLGVPGTRILPYPSRFFGLPRTHRLVHTADDQIRSTFLVWVLGFFVGMKLSESDKGLLDAAPITKGKCSDIVWGWNDLNAALVKADDFFVSHRGDGRIELAVRAAIHSYLLAHSPLLLDFERFLYLYTALDAALAAHGHIVGPSWKKPKHCKQIAVLCEQLNVVLPWWAEEASPYVSDVRNKAFHEGLFLGEPWGFATFGRAENGDPKLGMILLELEKLMNRIIMALLNVRDETYLKSKVDDRNRHRVRLLN